MLKYHFQRSTKDFKILVSNDLMTWEDGSIEGTLTKPSGNCGQMVEFSSTNPKQGRFVRFVAQTFFEVGAALQYFGLKYGKEICMNKVDFYIRIHFHSTVVNVID